MNEDLAMMALFTVGPPVALLLFAVSIVAVVILPRGRREGFVVCAAVLTAVGLVGVFIMVWMWGIGFDYADANKPVPPAIDDSMVFGFFVACASYAGVLAAGLLAAARRNRLKSTPT
ncbi:MAG: hypothetical protein M3Q98_12020 [Actinomycetota bacterium]|nr:hypothetical protein [Actinomycetota bacterium]